MGIGRHVSRDKQYECLEPVSKRRKVTQVRKRLFVNEQENQYIQNHPEHEPHRHRLHTRTPSHTRIYTLKIQPPKKQIEQNDAHERNKKNTIILNQARRKREKKRHQCSQKVGHRKKDEKSKRFHKIGRAISKRAPSKNTTAIVAPIVLES